MNLHHPLWPRDGILTPSPRHTLEVRTALASGAAQHLIKALTARTQAWDCLFNSRARQLKLDTANGHIGVAVGFMSAYTLAHQSASGFNTLFTFALEQVNTAATLHNPQAHMRTLFPKAIEEPISFDPPTDT